MAQDAYNCNPTHSLATVSLTSGINGAILSVSASLLNGSILYTLIKERNKRLQGMFQSPLLYTVTTDFFSGLVTNMVFSVVHFVEWKQSIPVWVLRCQHVLIFVTTGLALVNVAFQGVDRIFAICKPLKHRIYGRRSWKWWLPLILTWILSSASVSLYFVVGFFSYLVTFTFINVTIPILMMVLVLIIYILKKYDYNLQGFANDNVVRPRKFQEIDSGMSSGTHFESSEKTKAHPSKSIGKNSKLNAAGVNTRSDLWKQGDTRIFTTTESHQNEVPEGTAQEENKEYKSSQNDCKLLFPESDQNISQNYLFVTTSGAHPKGIIHAGSNPRKTTLPIESTSKEEMKKSDVLRGKGTIDKQIIRALILSLSLFVLTYAPTVALIIYLNTCENCNCYLVHVMRDATLQFILAGSFFRPIALLISAKTIRRQTSRIFCRKTQRDKE